MFSFSFCLVHLRLFFKSCNRLQDYRVMGHQDKNCKFLYMFVPCEVGDRNRSLALILLAVFLSCRVKMHEDVAVAYRALPDKISYNSHVRPVLSDKCFLCHGPDERKREAGLRLDIRDGAFARLESDNRQYAIVRGKPHRSALVQRILSDDPDFLMPTPESKLLLSDREKAIIIKWIEQGAEYEPHWALVPPRKMDFPETVNTDNPIDFFINRKLEEQGLEKSPEAAKSILLRRLSFDLTGLPPTPEQLAEFSDDNSPEAYERQVDRLLQSPQYGERMAVDWMDLARYADTHGYQADRYRDMSPWRDWVIKSFNENMPYDEFITWQLAGDLLANPGRNQMIATGFNRLHPQNLEDGIVDEEFRVAYVADRTDVVGQGLLGLTLSCAKCHDHKYDPISQKDYYQLYSFFNNINETGLISWEGATPTPTLMLPTKEQDDFLINLQTDIEGQVDIINKWKQSKKEIAKDWTANKGYKAIFANRFPRGIRAYYDFDNKQLNNRVHPYEAAKMDRRFSKGEEPIFDRGLADTGLKFDGDAWLDLGEVGLYRRSDPFTVALHIYLPNELKNGFILHKGMGTRLHSYRGYHLYLKDNKLELMMAHTWPDNAIVEYSEKEVPKDQWVHLVISYDGSSSASGYKLYQNGIELKTVIEIDNLYKDIIFHNLEDVIYSEPIEPGLQFGARWRGKGTKDAIIDNVMVFDRSLTPLEILHLADPAALEQKLDKPPDEKALDQLLQLYFANDNSFLRRANKKLQELRTVQADSMEKVKEVMVMREMASRRRAYILERGLYSEYGEEVLPGVPEGLLPWPDGEPKNRLGLAKWIVHSDHPLTARVAVNRYWQNIFGRGIVKTSEDFGMQGDLPSHPELLDWLAIYFVDSGWDVKALIKLIVTSDTYKQDSKLGQESLIDRDNMWLSRGPSGRLPSEMIRDNALFASGLLDMEIGGESVKPYQPDDLYSMNMDPYREDSGKKLYRRSLYTYWRRTIPHPTLATFDVPDRSECTVRRQKTNTPLQALVLLNDPAYLEAARVIGENILKAPDFKAGVDDAFMRLTGRLPSEAEISILENAHRNEVDIFSKYPRKGNGLLSIGEHVPNSDLNNADLAASTVIGSVLINLDASLMKR